MLMLSQKNLPKASLTELANHFILTETVMRIKLLPPAGIERSPILHKLEIILKVLGALLIEKPQFSYLHELGNLLECIILVTDLVFERLLVVAGVLVDVDLNRDWVYAADLVLGLWGAFLGLEVHGK